MPSLTESHRLAQARLGAVTVRRMRGVWKTLNPDNVDASFDRWLRAVMAIIEAQYAASADLAAKYLTAFKAQRIGAVPDLPDVAVNTEAVATSMLVTGPLSIKRAMARGEQLDAATRTAEVASSRSAQRHAMAGGIALITASVRRDRQATGYRRVTSGSPCAYCADLEGTEFADDEVFTSHDGCNCQAEPIYR